MIVRQLELDRRGELPSRWMAHHLAELITTAKTAEGEVKQQAQDRAAELILKLWTNRRALPTPADPLHGHLAAIKVLGTMSPAADPWRRFRRNSEDELLGDMFSALVQLVMGGLMLTRGEDMRKIEDAEWDALSEEEKFLIEVLNRWHDFLVKAEPQEMSLEAFYMDFLKADAAAEGEVASVDPEETQRELDPEREQRAAILAHVETFQVRLADLIERWRTACEFDDHGDTRLDDESSC